MEHKSIYELAVEQMKPEDIDSHETDLYLRKNDISDKLVDEYEFKNIVTTFVDEIDHVLWYDIPFVYPKKR